jgi:hypothetical protein
MTICSSKLEVKMLVENLGGKGSTEEISPSLIVLIKISLIFILNFFSKINESI